jgi:hypothetical protein
MKTQNIYNEKKPSSIYNIDQHITTNLEIKRVTSNEKKSRCECWLCKDIDGGSYDLFYGIHPEIQTKLQLRQSVARLSVSPSTSGDKCKALPHYQPITLLHAEYYVRNFDKWENYVYPGVWCFSKINNLLTKTFIFMGKLRLSWCMMFFENK